MRSSSDGATTARPRVPAPALGVGRSTSAKRTDWSCGVITTPRTGAQAMSRPRSKADVSALVAPAHTRLASARSAVEERPRQASSTSTSGHDRDGAEAGRRGLVLH